MRVRYSVSQEWRSLRTLGLLSYAYHTWLYRPHMRVWHALGWHWFKTYPPIDRSPRLCRCEWCGATKEPRT